MYVNNTHGYIYTPGFPSNYPNSAICHYVVQSHDKGTVQINFFVLSLENCCDFVSVYEGNTTSKSALIKRVSGKIRNTTSILKTKKSNFMTIVFTSDKNINKLGFYAVFSSLTLSKTADQTNHVETLTLPFGAFVSPNFPKEYPPNANAKYLIGTGVTGTVVQITIHFFNTEGCCDKVYIYDDKTKNANNLLIALSGTSPVVGHTYTSSNPYLYIEFTSDSNNQQQGFSFKYRIIPTPQIVAAVMATKVKTLANVHLT